MIRKQEGRSVYLRNRMDDYLHIIMELMESSAVIFESLDEDPALYLSEFQQNIPQWLYKEWS